ncbi:alpha-ketoglutarate-dependent dioxygenase AlkB family protein [Shewanella gaetbuli]|uniref:Alpha-ketoglutarate-dependent dioxygenase AlkB n=1 Tax=Shewanella gaetbuli TaxID=220752 RepID=A0A9X2CHC6_9GAMM|nr:alpha-ketoglutarate-dependent dioxygenase AlkB [Shewanella gaetbuli]MCL1141887.1 alpha-ketoglutarate-dependent dioxygenase AlkB [Shewanella gaetbuli]
MTGNLFDDGTNNSITPPVSHFSGFLSAQQQSLLLAEVTLYPLTQLEITVYGKKHLIPRTQAWFGDEGCDYRYSKTLISPEPWPPILSRLREKLFQDCQLDFNAVLVNQYANGSDCMGWHSDDEPEIQPNSAIASVTLGACRDFVIKHKTLKHKFIYPLQSGDLFIMHPGMQQEWLHSLPKRLKVTTPRINFTFRRIIANFYR